MTTETWFIVAFLVLCGLYCLGSWLYERHLDGPPQMYAPHHEVMCMECYMTGCEDCGLPIVHDEGCSKERVVEIHGD